MNEEELKLIAGKLIHHIQQNDYIFDSFVIFFEEKEYWHKIIVTNGWACDYIKEPMLLPTTFTREKHITLSFYGQIYTRTRSHINIYFPDDCLKYLNEIFLDVCLNKIGYPPLYRFYWDKGSDYTYLFDKDTLLYLGM